MRADVRMRLVALPVGPVGVIQLQKLIYTENLFSSFDAKKNKIWHSKNNPKLKEIILEAGYWDLTTSSHDLPKEWLVSKEKSNIAEIMQRHIPLLIYNIKTTDDFDNEEHTLEKGGYPLNEYKNNGHFINEMRELICKEMSAIGVNFDFWQNQKTKLWKFISLIDSDKLKIIENFNLNIILPPKRAKKVQKVWLGFCELYQML
ncbi:600_t:CDS:2, partial [Racocetra fulgida]